MVQDELVKEDSLIYIRKACSIKSTDVVFIYQKYRKKISYFQGLNI